MMPGLQSIAGAVNLGPRVTYLGTYSSTTDRNGSNYTFTINLGSESPDRLIVINAAIAAEGSGALTGATLAGNTMDVVAATYYQNTDRGSISMFSKNVSTGSSISLAVQHTGSPTYSIVVDVFSVIGLTSLTAHHTVVANGTANSMSGALNVPKSGVIIGGGGGWGTSTPFTWTGITSKVSELNSGDGGAQLSSAIMDGTVAQTGRTVSWSTPSTGSRRGLVAASWA